jgi:hypothetical protein
VSTKRDLAKFTTLIRKNDLQEMEAINKEWPGLFDTMMEFIATDSPKNFES